MANVAHFEIGLPDLSQVHLQPGDVLVFRHEKQISDALEALIKEQCAKLFPDHPVIVLDGGLELAVLRPTERGVGSLPAAAPGAESLG